MCRVTYDDHPKRPYTVLTEDHAIPSRGHQGGEMLEIRVERFQFTPARPQVLGRFETAPIKSLPDHMDQEIAGYVVANATASQLGLTVTQHIQRIEEKPPDVRTPKTKALVGPQEAAPPPPKSLEDAPRPKPRIDTAYLKKLEALKKAKEEARPDREEDTEAKKKAKATAEKRAKAEASRVEEKAKAIAAPSVEQKAGPRPPKAPTGARPAKAKAEVKAESKAAPPQSQAEANAIMQKALDEADAKAKAEAAMTTFVDTLCSEPEASEAKAKAASSVPKLMETKAKHGPAVIDIEREIRKDRTIRLVRRITRTETSEEFVPTGNDLSPWSMADVLEGDSKDTDSVKAVSLYESDNEEWQRQLKFKQVKIESSSNGDEADLSGLTYEKTTLVEDVRRMPKKGNRFLKNYCALNHSHEPEYCE